MRIYNLILHLYTILILVMSKSMIEQAYFKEYLCYEFDSTKDMNNSPRTIDYHINFRESANLDVDTLPSVLIDKMSSKEMLYLIDYKSQGGHQLLFIKELNDEKWKIIQMNFLPQSITISGGLIYMIAGRSLAMCALYFYYQNNRTVVQGKIISVKPCAVQYQDKKEQLYQPGISITYFTQNHGYSFKLYSIHSTQSGETNGLSRITNYILFKKFVEYRHFQIIIPNLIALVFLSDNQFCLFNIQTGLIEESTKAKLIFSRLDKEEKPIIKWKQHAKVKNFDKNLILAIGANSSIEIFFIFIKYLPNFQNQLLETSLQDIHNGNFIDWSHTLVGPYMHLHASANIIVDLAISKTGIVYYSRDQLSSQIGNCNYIDLNSPFIQSPLLTHQASIWRMYYQDKELYLTDKNRFFMPNRYPIELVLSNKSGHSDELKPVLLNGWRSHYKFKHMISYNEEMIIVRGRSLSTFRAIQEELYNYLYFSEEKLSLLDHIQKHRIKNNRQIETMFIKNGSEFQEPIFHSFIDRPISKQRSYKIISQEDLQQQEQSEKNIQAKFRSILKIFDKIMSQDIKDTYTTLNISQFRLGLACGQLYDCLNYYHLIINSKAFRINFDSLKLNTEEYQRYTCIVRVINYFYQLLQRSEQQFSYFGNNLIALFIANHLNYLTSDIDSSIHSFLKLMFQNLLPLQSKIQIGSQIQNDDQDSQQICSNSFIQFLISQLIKSLEQQGTDSQKSNYLRGQLSYILKMGFHDNKFKIFAKYWSNTSFLKAFLLCNDKKDLPTYLCQYLLKKEPLKYLSIYHQIVNYINLESIVIFENLLLLNQPFHTLQPDIFYITKSQASQSIIAQISNSIKKDIYHQNYLNWHSSKTNIRGQILNQIEQITQAEAFNQNEWMSLKQKISSAQFGKEEQLLQFYEHVLAALIKLFNSKIKIDDWVLCSQTLDPAQYDRLVQKKGELLFYLDQIESTFTHYKRQYIKIYEENIQDSQQYAPSIEKRYNFQKILLTERFIENPQQFYFFENYRGLICCSMSINLIRQALSNNFQQSLQVYEDLVCFWMNLVKNQMKKSVYQATLYLEMIYIFNRSEVENYLKNDDSLFQRLERVYADIKNQASYKFFNLFKGHTV